jgi:hypothetical protein
MGSGFKRKLLRHAWGAFFVDGIFAIVGKSKSSYAGARFIDRLTI